MLNSKIEMHIERVVPCGDRILVDAEQRFSPWLWPAALLSPLGWRHHVIMTTVDNPAGCVLCCVCRQLYCTLTLQHPPAGLRGIGPGL